MNLPQIIDRFPTETHLVKYFELLRWGKQPKCAYCNSKSVTPLQKDNRRKCKKCNKSYSVKVGTVLEDTRIPIQKWVLALSVITDAKKGISALQLQRNIGVHYRTAFKLYHKIRMLMFDENQEIKNMKSIVEMDETFIGGKPRKPNNITNLSKEGRKKLDIQIKSYKEAGISFRPKSKNTAKIDLNPKRGRGTSKIPVVGIVQRNGNVVAQVMQNLTYPNLKKMVQKYVDEESAVLITDEYKGYSRMKNIIEHVKIEHKKLYSYKGINTNTIESFWAIIERGIMGQYHSVSPKYLPNYIAEFVYKYNNRKDNTAMFYEMLEKIALPINA